MRLSKKKYQEQKNREAERALQKIIGGINIGKIKIIAFSAYSLDGRTTFTIQWKEKDET